MLILDCPRAFLEVLLNLFQGTSVVYQLHLTNRNFTYRVYPFIDDQPSVSFNETECKNFINVN